MDDIIKIFTAEILDDDSSFSLQELSEVCHVRTEFIIQLVEYGILEPRGKTQHSWQFDHVALKRSQISVRLQRDLELDVKTLPLVLQLIEELQQLRAKVELLQRHIT